MLITLKSSSMLMKSLVKIFLSFFLSLVKSKHRSHHTRSYTSPSFPLFSVEEKKNFFRERKSFVSLVTPSSRKRTIRFPPRSKREGKTRQQFSTSLQLLRSYRALRPATDKSACPGTIVQDIILRNDSRTAGPCAVATVPSPGRCPGQWHRRRGANAITRWYADKSSWPNRSTRSNRVTPLVPRAPLPSTSRSRVTIIFL